MTLNDTEAPPTFGSVLLLSRHAGPVLEGGDPSSHMTLEDRNGRRPLKVLIHLFSGIIVIRSKT